VLATHLLHRRVYNNSSPLRRSFAALVEASRTSAPTAPYSFRHVVLPSIATRCSPADARFACRSTSHRHHLHRRPAADLPIWMLASCCRRAAAGDHVVAVFVILLTFGRS